MKLIQVNFALFVLIFSLHLFPYLANAYDRSNNGEDCLLLHNSYQADSNKNYKVCTGTEVFVWLPEGQWAEGTLSKISIDNTVTVTVSYGDFLKNLFFRKREITTRIENVGIKLSDYCYQNPNLKFNFCSNDEVIADFWVSYFDFDWPVPAYSYKDTQPMIKGRLPALRKKRPGILAEIVGIFPYNDGRFIHGAIVRSKSRIRGEYGLINFVLYNHMGSTDPNNQFSDFSESEIEDFKKIMDQKYFSDVSKDNYLLHFKDIQHQKYDPQKERQRDHLWARYQETIRRYYSAVRQNQPPSIRIGDLLLVDGCPLTVYALTPKGILSLQKPDGTLYNHKVGANSFIIWGTRSIYGQDRIDEKKCAGN